MQQHFYFGVFIPSLNRKVYFKELNIRQLKNIVKTILNNDDVALVYAFNDLIKENCKENIDILDITILDRFLILLNMRIVSIGNIQTVQLTCDETQKPYEIIVDYNQLVDNIASINFDDIVNITNKNITIEYGIPLAFRVPEQFMYDTSHVDVVARSIRHIKIGDIEYNLSTLDFFEINRIIEKLPIIFSEDIQKYLDAQEIKSNTVNFITTINPHTIKTIEQKMSLSDNILTRILKIAYNCDLHGLYKGIYYMVNVLKFTPEYVETLTPNEKQLYWSYYLSDEAAKEKKEKNSNNEPQMRDATGDFLNDIQNN